MEFVLVSRALDRLPIAHPKQITEDFRLKTQEVTYSFRGFVVTPVVDSNGIKLCYTGKKEDVVNLTFSSCIIVDTSECQTKLFIGFGGAPILRYYDSKNNLLEHQAIWHGNVFMGDHLHGFENFPFSQTYIEIFTPSSHPKYFTSRNNTMVPILPPPSPLPMPKDVLPSYEELVSDKIIKRVKV